MLEITILSGKGGTGKTTITSSLANFAENAVFCDNDVDASNLHVLFQPEIKEKQSFPSGYDLTINQEKCTQCNLCMEQCRFDAVKLSADGQYSIDNMKCEACLLCERICPVEAIQSEPKTNNYWFVSETRFGPLVHARMGPGEENSGKLVSQIKKKARDIANEKKSLFIIHDGPPGIGCSTIASLSGTDVVLLVAEPSLSSLHDIKRLLKLMDSFQLRAFALINKYDLNYEISGQVKEFLNSVNIPVIAEIDFDMEFIQSQVNGLIPGEINRHSESFKKLEMAWNVISNPQDK
jgi:MinD superfamily P-loop ATPase